VSFLFEHHQREKRKKRGEERCSAGPTQAHRDRFPIASVPGGNRKRKGIKSNSVALRILRRHGFTGGKYKASLPAAGKKKTHCFYWSLGQGRVSVGADFRHGGRKRIPEEILLVLSISNSYAA